MHPLYTSVRDTCFVILRYSLEGGAKVEEGGLLGFGGERHCIEGFVYFQWSLILTFKVMRVLVQRDINS